MLFIKDSARGANVFYLNHHLTIYKSFTESHVNHTSINYQLWGLT